MMWEADESHDLWDDEPRNRINRATAGDATDRFVTGNLTSEDLDVERSLRPQRLDDYCGQGHIKDSLRILIQAAQSRGECLDHVIFSGPPGLGKNHVGHGGGQRDGGADQDHLGPRDCSYW